MTTRAVTPLVDLGLVFRSLSTNINPKGITQHYGGDSPWGAADRSTPERFAATTDHRRCPSIVRAWHDFHLSKGWAGLAYTSGFCPHGWRYEGRGPGKRTAAQGTNDGNDRSYACCYIAGGQDPVTVGAKLALLDEADRLAALRWDHSDWHNTACAGAQLRAWKLTGWASPDLPTEGDDDVEAATLLAAGNPGARGVPFEEGSLSDLARQDHHLALVADVRQAAMAANIKKLVTASGQDPIDEQKVVDLLWERLDPALRDAVIASGQPAAVADEVMTRLKAAFEAVG